MVDSTGVAKQPYTQITGNPGHLNLSQGSTPGSQVANAIYADGIVKAWGSFNVLFGVVPSGDFFGVASATYSGSAYDPVIITLINALDNASYNVVCSASIPPGTNGLMTSIQNTTTTSFEIFLIDHTGVVHPNFDTTTQVCFTVYGTIGG